MLALSESIGYVNTGLTENEMRRYIVKFKRSEVDQTSKSEVEKKCSICQVIEFMRIKFLIKWFVHIYECVKPVIFNPYCLQCTGRIRSW